MADTRINKKMKSKNKEKIIEGLKKYRFKKGTEFLSYINRIRTWVILPTKIVYTDYDVEKAFQLKEQEILEMIDEEWPYIMCYGLKRDLTEKEIRRFKNIFNILIKAKFKERKWAKKK